MLICRAYNSPRRAQPASLERASRGVRQIPYISRRSRTHFCYYSSPSDDTDPVAMHIAHMYICKRFLFLSAQLTATSLSMSEASGKNVLSPPLVSIPTAPYPWSPRSDDWYPVPPQPANRPTTGDASRRRNNLFATPAACMRATFSTLCFVLSVARPFGCERRGLPSPASSLPSRGKPGLLRVGDYHGCYNHRSAVVAPGMRSACSRLSLMSP